MSRCSRPVLLGYSLVHASQILPDKFEEATLFLQQIHYVLMVGAFNYLVTHWQKL